MLGTGVARDLVDITETDPRSGGPGTAPDVDLNASSGVDRLSLNVAALIEGVTRLREYFGKANAPREEPRGHHAQGNGSPRRAFLDWFLGRGATVPKPAAVVSAGGGREVGIRTADLQIEAFCNTICTLEGMLINTDESVYPWQETGNAGAGREALLVKIDRMIRAFNRLAGRNGEASPHDYGLLHNERKLLADLVPFATELRTVLEGINTCVEKAADDRRNGEDTKPNCSDLKVPTSSIAVKAVKLIEAFLKSESASTTSTLPI